MFHSTIPSLFGRPEGVRTETAALRSTIAGLRGVCGSLRSEAPDGALKEARRLLADFSTALSGHFEAEESDGYFRTIVADCPHLGPQVARLERSHAAFRDALARLGRLASQGGKSARMIGGRIASVVDVFELHEHAENDLLQEFFLRDEGGGE